MSYAVIHMYFFFFYLCGTTFGKGKETKKAKNNIYIAEVLFIIVNNWRQVQHKMLKEPFGKL